MTTLAEVLRAKVTPTLAPLGYRKTGNTYRLIAENGDQALMNFQVSSGSVEEDVIFFVNVAVVPKTQIDLNNSITGQSQPTPADGILSDRVAPPADVKYDNNSRFTDERWQFSSPEAAERVGKHLVEILPGVHSVLAPLLDRRTFLAYLQQGDQQPFKAENSVRNTVMLLLDEGHSPELDEALAQSKAPKWVAWVENYLQKVEHGTGSPAI